MYGPKTLEGWGNGFSVVGPSGGGGGAQGPKGDTGPIGYGDSASFYDTSTVTLSKTLPQAVPLNTTDHSSGVTMVDGSKITFSHAGTYNIAFSTVVLKADSGDDDVFLWMKKNNIDIPWTNTSINLAKNSNQVVAWNFFVTVNANDYLQLFIYSPVSSTATQIISYPSTGHAAPAQGPGIPGTILTVNQVA